MTRRTTTPSPRAPPGSTQRYRDRIYDDRSHDPYQTKGKYAEPAVCSDCHAVYQHGHWVRDAAPVGASPVLCPACHRIRDKQPAGYLTLEGALVEGDREELVRIARNVEKREAADHPLHRIIAIEKNNAQVLITTTDVHLPQRIGEAVRHAHKGRLEVTYAHDEYVARVRWSK